MPLGSSAAFDGAHHFERYRVLHLPEQLALQLTDAVLGRD